MSNIKPLNGKAYGSIPHLPGSKYGDKRDQGITPEAAVHFTTKPKQPGDVVFVTEKLDGSCVAVLKNDNELYPLIRAGYHAYDSKWRQHHLFAAWVGHNADKFHRLLHNGERVCGEWLAQAHGTRYDLQHRKPFAAFDLITGQERESYDHFFDRVNEAGIATVPFLARSNAVSIEYAMRLLGDHGLYGAEKPEGAVWRIERGGRFMSIAKYVRPDHEVGCLLPEISGGPEVWNWRP